MPCARLRACWHSLRRFQIPMNFSTIPFPSAKMTLRYSGMPPLSLHPETMGKGARILSYFNKFRLYLYSDSNNAQAIFFMKIQGCKTEFGNASAFIGYLMRAGETGLLCVSEIMRNEIFQRDVVNLQRQQKTDFLTQFGSKLDWWQNRQLTDKDSLKVRANRARILARAQMVDDDGLIRKIHRTPDHELIQEVVHSISLTQKFHQTAGGSSGKEFI